MFVKFLTLSLLFWSCNDHTRLPASRLFSCAQFVGSVARTIESERIIDQLTSLNAINPTRVAEGSATLVHRVELQGSNLSAIFKEQLQGGVHLNFEISNTKAEVLAYELDRIFKLFLVPPTSSRAIEIKPGTEVWGSIQQEMVHLYSLEKLSSGSKIKNNEIWDEIISRNSFLKSRELDKLSLFDYLIHNGDRHLNNILVTKDGSIIAIDHGAAFTGQGKHLSAFYRRRVQIDRFLATDEGQQLVNRLRQFDRKKFKEFLHQYISSYEARTLLIRMDGILKREAYSTRFNILQNFDENRFSKFLETLVNEKNYDEIQLLIEASDIDDSATNTITSYIYKKMDKASREELIKNLYIDPESQLSHKMMVARVYGG